MSTTGVKEYIIRINGVAQSIKDVTSLKDAVDALSNSFDKASSNTQKMGDSTRKTKAATDEAAKASKAKKAAMTDEEKAAKKLADTQKKIADVSNEANKAQIAATQELRERTREITRQVAASNLAEGSIKAMGMQLTDLRNEYEALSAAERNEQETGGKLLEQIQALDAEYKALRESTGNFRDSVGNYEKAITGLNRLKDNFEKASRGSAEMAASVTGSSAVFEAFNHTTDIAAKSSRQLAGVVGLASAAQEAYNAVVKEGWLQQKAAAVMDGVRAVQIKAKTAAEALSTKGTIAATVAQKAFNIVANANPYVLLAAALITVVGALALFASNTDKAAESQERLNRSQLDYVGDVAEEVEKMKEAGKRREQALERQIALLQAAGAKTEEIRAVEDKLAQERLSNAHQFKGAVGDWVKDLEGNQYQLEQINKELENLKKSAEDEIRVSTLIDGKGLVYKTEKAIELAQQQADKYAIMVRLGIEAKEAVSQQEYENKLLKETQAKADREAAKERADRAKAAAQERADIQLNAVRAAEDAEIELIEDAYKRQQRLTEVQYDREIEDLNARLKERAKLTEEAEKAINDRITSLGELKKQALEKLEAERAEKELQDVRAAEDARIALISDAGERQRAEINLRYDRQVKDLQRRLDTEKDLTQKQQDAITQLITHAYESRARELDELAAKDTEKRNAQELASLEFALKQAFDKITDYTGKLEKRSNKGFKLIDVKATRKNLADANAALDEFITGLNKSDVELKKNHEATLAGLKAGTQDYIDEVQKYAEAHEDVTKRIKDAQAKQRENTRKSAGLMMQYIQELTKGIADEVQKYSDAITAILDSSNQVLQLQTDALNEQLDSLNDRYDEAQRMSEDAAKGVEDLESRIQDATGGTAQALKEQLADQMAARNEAARQEQQLQKEKEKREKEIAKKERQMKRNELISNIAMAIANTAQGVTKSLSLVFPLNLLVAGIVAAFGLVQVGIMTKQLTKLSEGGPIIGPSHSNGGVPIGMGYEAEGGEFVTNKTAYAANKPLVEFINASNRTITGADLFGVIPDDTLSAPVIIMNNSDTDSDRIVEAIENIDMHPVVAVTDIMDVQDQVVTVRDLSGF